jgi:hypothetical protein
MSEQKQTPEAAARVFYGIGRSEELLPAWKEKVDQLARLLTTREAALRTEIEEAKETRDFFANRLNEALGALGYEVPGDTPEGRYHCGLCGPKNVALMDADHEWALWREKWIAALDLMGKQAERAERAEAQLAALLERVKRLEEAVKAGLDHLHTLHAHPGRDADYMLEHKLYPPCHVGVQMREALAAGAEEEGK